MAPDAFAEFSAAIDKPALNDWLRSYVLANQTRGFTRTIGAVPIDQRHRRLARLRRSPKITLLCRTTQPVTVDLLSSAAKP